MKVIRNKNALILLAAIICALAGVWSIFKAIHPSNSDYGISQIEFRLQGEINNTRHQLIPALQINDSTEDLFSILNSIKADYPFFIYKNGELIYWSDNQYVPNYNEVGGNFKYKLLESEKGKYLVIKWVLPDSNIEVVSTIVLFFNSQIDNRYISSTYNSLIFQNENVEIKRLGFTETKEICIVDNQCLFGVKLGEDFQFKNLAMQHTGVVLVFAGLILLTVLSYRISINVAKKKGIIFAFGFLVFFLTVMRGITIWMGFPLKFVDADLFNPEFFASSYLNPSIGDLLFNVLLILIAVAFIFKNQKLVIEEFLNAKKNWKLLTGVVFVALLCLATLQLWLVIQTIYHNSQYDLDIGKSLYFSIERIVLMILFVCNSIIFFLISHVLLKALLSIETTMNKLQLMAMYLSGIAVFLLVNFLTSQNTTVSLILTLIYFIVIRFANMPKRFDRVSYAAFIYLFVGMMICSILGSIAIYQFENEQAKNRKQRFALQFLIEKDMIAEYLLSDASANIANDAFIKNRLFSPFLSKSIVNEKVKRVYLNKYFDKYNVNIFVFNSNGEPYEGNETLNYHQLKDKLEANQRLGKTNTYFIHNRENNFTKRYVSLIEVKNYGLVSGYIVIDLQHKKIIPDNVYPELLVDNRLLLPYINKNYSYAVYMNKTIQFNSGDFNYSTDFDTNWLGNIGNVTNNKYDHLIVGDESDNRYVVVTSKTYGFFRIVSNFSFLLLTLMFTTLLLGLIYILYFYSSRKALNYSTRIQLYFNLAFFMPLITVSVATLTLVTSSYSEEVDHEHYKKALVISENIEAEIDLDGNLNSDVMENRLSVIAAMSNTDASLFDTQGRLIASSQPLIYKKNIFSKRLSPVAMSNILERRDDAITVNESVGTLTYNTNYKAIKSPSTGEIRAVLSVPYFESELNLEHEKIEVFTTILNIFTIIFILFLAISYLASRLLIFPLTLITQKLKQTTLATNNEPLEWAQDDEIGLMVKEYNKMVSNLAESKKALARTEKETAWREIAQQVAHEIKNPLTPMKLTLQHLQRTILGDKEQKAIQKPIDSLLYQVDTLSDIATSFSSFAQMPIPEHERYELTQLVSNTIDLHKNTDIGELTAEISRDPIYTIGDEQLMGRILSNLIINASQAASDNKVVIFVVLKSINKRKVLLEVTDNGMGIPDDIRDKIFMPNFTTKESGTGIGLAIAKHGIEHAGGKIWFETSQNKGTTFSIELPEVD